VSVCVMAAVTAGVYTCVTSKRLLLVFAGHTQRENELTHSPTRSHTHSLNHSLTRTLTHSLQRCNLPSSAHCAPGRPSFQYTHAHILSKTATCKEEAMQRAHHEGQAPHEHPGQWVGAAQHLAHGEGVRTLTFSQDMVHEKKNVKKRAAQCSHVSGERQRDGERDDREAKGRHQEAIGVPPRHTKNSTRFQFSM
jgi:hypothetical protein